MTTLNSQEANALLFNLVFLKELDKEKCLEIINAAVWHSPSNTSTIRRLAKIRLAGALVQREQDCALIEVQEKEQAAARVAAKSLPADRRAILLKLLKKPRKKATNKKTRVIAEKMGIFSTDIFQLKEIVGG